MDIPENTFCTWPFWHFYNKEEQKIMGKSDGNKAEKDSFPNTHFMKVNIYKKQFLKRIRKFPFGILNFEFWNLAHSRYGIRVLKFWIFPG